MTDPGRSLTRAWLLLVGLVVVWGSHWVVVKVGLETIPPFTYGVLRLALPHIPAGRSSILACTIRPSSDASDCAVAVAPDDSAMLAMTIITRVRPTSILSYRRDEPYAQPTVMAR